MAENAKANSFIVVLKDGAAAASTDPAKASSAVSSAASSLSARYGGKVTSQYSRTIRGFSVDDLSDEQARKLAGDASVAYVERNSRVRAYDTQQSPTWGNDRIDQPSLPLNNSYTYPNTASNVTAYMVDSGMAAYHPEFEGRAIYGPNFRRDHYGPDQSYDCYGHGTHVAGTVGSHTYGVAKQIKLVSVRVMGCDGNGWSNETIEAIEWVTSDASGKLSVANFSAGFEGRVWSFEAALRASIAAGVLWSLAAGNDYVDACNNTPTAVTEALVTGAVDNADNGASFSNYGACVDLYAPGVDIWSTYFSGGDYKASGTSMAAAHTTGAAALILSAHPGYTPGQVHNAVVQSSANGIVKGVPGGTPNKLLQVRQSDPPQVAGKTATLYNPRFGTTEVYARATNGNLIYAYYLQGWSNWINLGGNIQGDPSVFYNPSNGSTEVYVRTADNKVGYIRYVNGWTGWGTLGTQTVGGSPQVIYNPRFRTTEIYVRTADNKLAFTYFANNKWSAVWTNLGGTLTSDPGLVYNPRYGTTEAYVRNTAGKVEYKYYSDKWSDWKPLDGSVAEGANPVVLFNPRFSTTEVYARDANNNLTYTVYTNQWLAWRTPIGGVILASDPALLYNPRFGSTEVYVRTSDNAVRYIYYLDKWYGWNNLGTAFTGNPALIFNPRWGTTEVYARNSNDGHANYRYYANGWSGWNDISA